MHFYRTSLSHEAVNVHVSFPGWHSNLRSQNIPLVTHFPGRPWPSAVMALVPFPLQADGSFPKLLLLSARRHSVNVKHKQIWIFWAIFLHVINGIIHSVFRESISKKQSGLHFLYFLRKLPKNCVCKPSFSSTAYEIIKVFSKSSSFIHSFIQPSIPAYSRAQTFWPWETVCWHQNPWIMDYLNEHKKYWSSCLVSRLTTDAQEFLHSAPIIYTSKLAHSVTFTCRRMPFKLQVKNLFMTHDFRILS